MVLSYSVVDFRESPMTLAVMTRATLGHTGHDLSADRATITIFLLASLAAIARVAAAVDAVSAMPLFEISAGFWIDAFALFTVRCGPMLQRRRVLR
jgi:uncharacterized protein involved in response to NO